jgi:hypothetical protein
MSKVQVVEIRTLNEDEVVTPIVRFVLKPEGRAHLVELSPNAQSMVAMLLGKGVPGPDGTMLFPQDGLAFMQRLPYLLHAAYLWATDVFEMDAAEALAGTEQDS